MLLSLCSGCGGLDFGFEDVGWRVGLAYDWNPDAVSSWNSNREDGQCARVFDLTKIRLRDIDRDFGGRFVPTGVIGGPPCQGFSRANQKRYRNDHRNALVRRVFTIALRFHRHRAPLDFILVENVPELAMAPNVAILDREIHRLEANDFAVTVFTLDATRFCVPQRRRRVFVLALRRGSRAADCWRKPDGSNDAPRTVDDAIGGLPDPVVYRRGLSSCEIPYHPNHWCMRPKSRRFFDGSLVAGDVWGRSFKTLPWDAPSITVAYGHREVHVHPEGRRRLSVFEAMRLQGFPDSYVLTGTLSSQIAQVSEAVPPPLARGVAVSIAESLFPARNGGGTRLLDLLCGGARIAGLDQ